MTLRMTTALARQRFCLRSLYRPGMALTCLAVLAASCAIARAQRTIPLEYTVSGENHATGFDPGPPPVLSALAVGTGTGTLGIDGVAYTLTLDLSTATAQGTSVYTTSNGEQLFATILPFPVTFVPNTPNVTWQADAVFTGGTGIFAGATGSAIESGDGVVLDPNPQTFANTFHIQGVGTLNLVPEPGVYALLASLGVVAALRYRRRILCP